MVKIIGDVLAGLAGVPLVQVVQVVAAGVILVGPEAVAMYKVLVVVVVARFL